MQTTQDHEGEEGSGCFNLGVQGGFSEAGTFTLGDTGAAQRKTWARESQVEGTAKSPRWDWATGKDGWAWAGGLGRGCCTLLTSVGQQWKSNGFKGQRVGTNCSLPVSRLLAAKGQESKSNQKREGSLFERFWGISNCSLAHRLGEQQTSPLRLALTLGS